MRCSPAAIAMAIAFTIGAGLTIADTPAAARAVAGNYIVRYTDAAVSKPAATSSRSRVRVGDIASGWRVDTTQIDRRFKSARVAWASSRSTSSSTASAASPPS